MLEKKYKMYHNISCATVLHQFSSQAWVYQKLLANCRRV
jgi:hypothetical protein